MITISQVALHWRQWLGEHWRMNATLAGGCVINQGRLFPIEPDLRHLTMNNENVTHIELEQACAAK